MMREQSLEDAEIEKFDRLASDWWDRDGEMRLLHAMHPARMRFIREHLDVEFPLGFERLTALDVGCGGGITAESLARLGFSVTGIDASARLIQTAAGHSRAAGLDIDYHHTDIADYADKNPASVDVLCAMEVIEHVADPEAFLDQCAGCLREGGVLFLSTINRTVKSRLLGIVLAEHVLKMLPVGTHDWQKFQKPSKIAAMLPNFRVLGLKGMLPEVNLREWRLSARRVQVNYVMALQKA